MPSGLRLDLVAARPLREPFDRPAGLHPVQVRRHRVSRVAVK